MHKTCRSAYSNLQATGLPINTACHARTHTHRTFTANASISSAAYLSSLPGPNRNPTVHQPQSRFAQQPGKQFTHTDTHTRSRPARGRNTGFPRNPPRSINLALPCRLRSAPVRSRPPQLAVCALHCSSAVHQATLRCYQAIHHATKAVRNKPG